MRIKEWIEEPNPFGLVKIEEIIERDVKEDELDLEQQVSLRYAKDTMAAVIKDFARLNMHLPPLFSDYKNVSSFVQLSLTVIQTVLRYIMPVSQMTGKERELIQDIFAEDNLTEKLRKLCVALVDLRRRVGYLIDAMRSEAQRGGGPNEGFEIPQPPPSYGKRKPGKGINEKAMPGDERAEDLKRFQKNLENKKVPPNVQKRIDEEINRYLQMEKYHPESSVIRTYLDYLTMLPWGISTTDSIDITNAKKVLDDSHYGMEDIK